MPKQDFKDNFEAASNKGWTVSRVMALRRISHRATGRWLQIYLTDRPGKAYFGPDPDHWYLCGPGGDESSVLHLDSPVIQVKNRENDKDHETPHGV